MSRRVIRVGDHHDHGGKVLSSGAPQARVGGISVALKGDPCNCPRPGHHPCAIAEGDEGHKIGGVPVAYEGHKTACGAVLQATVPNAAKS